METETKDSGQAEDKESSNKTKCVMNIQGYPVKGLSITGHETCIIFPSAVPTSLYSKTFSVSPMHTWTTLEKCISLSYAFNACPSSFWLYLSLIFYLMVGL